MPSGNNGAIKRVLIVDDCADSRRVVAACLRSESDLVATQAADGWSALRMIVDEEPDLIILDMDLPVLSGYLTARMVRACGGRLARLPIVALTGAIEADARARCMSAGVSDYMAKPLVDPAALVAKVRAALGHTEQRTTAYVAPITR